MKMKLWAEGGFDWTPRTTPEVTDLTNSEYIVIVGRIVQKNYVAGNMLSLAME